MKFRLLQCFLIAFAYVIGTCGVSVGLEVEPECRNGPCDEEGNETVDDPADECPLPLNDIKAARAIRSGLYQKIVHGYDSNGDVICALKLNVSVSKCATGTNVVYIYDKDKGTYKYDANNNDYIVFPDNGYYRLYGIDSTDVVDHCGSCNLGYGYYMDEKEGCTECPTDENIGANKLYQFVAYGNGQGIGSCAVQLNLSKSICASGTNVVYAYNSSTNNYDTLVSNTVKVNAGYYISGNDGLGDRCKACPVGNENLIVIGTGLLYQFIEYGNSREGVTSCAIRLNTDVSKCASGTNVVYKYNSDGGYKYNQESDDYIVIPKEGYTGYNNIDSTNLVDHCGACEAGHGKYIENGQCKICPLEGTNAEGEVGEDERFQFTDEYGTDTCAVKLKPYKDNCNSATNVVYVYNATQNKYIRKVSDVFPDTNSVIASPLPSTYDMKNAFCTECGKDEYNVNGTCGTCNEGGFYLQAVNWRFYSVDGQGSNAKMVCNVCPAGYYCPGDTIRTMCPVGTYSEGGETQCTPCPLGYSTMESGPVADGYDGLCLKREGDYGVGCVSRDACKFKMSGLSMVHSDGSWVLFYLSDNVKIESLNRSVIKTFPDVNPATMQTARPTDSDFWDEE